MIVYLELIKTKISVKVKELGPFVFVIQTPGIMIDLVCSCELVVLIVREIYQISQGELDSSQINK